MVPSQEGDGQDESQEDGQRPVEGVEGAVQQLRPDRPLADDDGQTEDKGPEHGTEASGPHEAPGSRGARQRGTAEGDPEGMAAGQGERRSQQVELDRSEMVGRHAGVRGTARAAHPGDGQGTVEDPGRPEGDRGVVALRKPSRRPRLGEGEDGRCEHGDDHEGEEPVVRAPPPGVEVRDTLGERLGSPARGWPTAGSDPREGASHRPGGTSRSRQVMREVQRRRPSSSVTTTCHEAMVDPSEMGVATPTT